MTTFYPLKTKNKLLRLTKVLVGLTLFFIFFGTFLSIHFWIYYLITPLIENLGNQLKMLIAAGPFLIYIYLCYKYSRKITGLIKTSKDTLLLKEGSLRFSPFNYTFDLKNTKVSFENLEYFSPDPETVGGGTIFSSFGITLKDDTIKLTAYINETKSIANCYENLPTTAYSFEKSKSVELLNRSDFNQLKNRLTKY